MKKIKVAQRCNAILDVQRKMNEQIYNQHSCWSLHESTVLQRMADNSQLHQRLNCHRLDTPCAKSILLTIFFGNNFWRLRTFYAVLFRPWGFVVVQKLQRTVTVTSGNSSLSNRNIEVYNNAYNSVESMFLTVETRSYPFIAREHDGARRRIWTRPVTWTSVASSASSQVDGWIIHVP